LAQVDHAEWNHTVRGETELQSVDRHFTELLQELRVAQTGVQILFAFLLGLAFTPRFPDLSAVRHEHLPTQPDPDLPVTC
jgi:hypothetical protein